MCIRDSLRLALARLQPVLLGLYLADLLFQAVDAGDRVAHRPEREALEKAIGRDEATGLSLSLKHI